MQPITLIKLKTQRYNYLSKSDVEKGIKFIHNLVEKGIPLSAIDVNSWEDSTVPTIYVTIPYGRPRGGTYKEYRRWSDRDAKMAKKFYSA